MGAMDPVQFDKGMGEASEERCIKALTPLEAADLRASLTTTPCGWRGFARAVGL